MRKICSILLYQQCRWAFKNPHTMKKHYAWKPLHVNFCCRYAADLLQIFTLDLNGEVKIHDHSAMKVYCCRFCCGNDAHFEYIDFFSRNISIICSKIHSGKSAPFAMDLSLWIYLQKCCRFFTVDNPQYFCPMCRDT